VLRSNGRLCIFWSAGHHPDDLADALQAAYQQVLPDNFPSLVIGYAANKASDPTADSGAVMDAIRACDKLSEPQTKSFPWRRRYSRDEWINQLLSHSDHIALDPSVREALVEEIGSTIDDFGGEFEMTYRTILISATRRSS
jgi:hypothetical protein